jgi:5-dehydro-2-deoxygluconokinase
MELGYDGKLFILAFDHRGSFRKKMFGIEGREPTPNEITRLADAKQLVWEGFKAALEAGLPDGAGALVDEEMGAEVAREAAAMGVPLAMPVEKSGQAEFDFEYGDAFGDHIEAFDPVFTKVLVRWNPEDDPVTKDAQSERLKRLGDWLHERDRKYLFELLVPGTEEQLASVDDDTAAYDAQLRPSLMVETISELRDAGVEPDVWKIEGIDERTDCEQIAALIREDGRDRVKAVVLGRGADSAKVDHWLQQGAPVDGYAGFAIGRSIWWDGVAGFKDGSMSRSEAADAIAAEYRRFIDVYVAAAG